MPTLEGFRTKFGIASFTAINRTTKLPYAKPIKVVTAAPINIKSDLVGLSGGALSGEVAAETGQTTIDIGLKIKEFPNFMYQLAGYTVTSTSAETSGNAGTAANEKGTSIVAATGIVAAASVTTAADLKNQTLIIVAVSSTTFDVYVADDLDFLANGTELSFQNNAGKINASALTMSTGSVVAIPGTGVSLTGGASATAFVTGDVAILRTRRINQGSDLIELAGSVTPVEFKAVLASQKQADGTIQYAEIHKCVFAPFSIPFQERQHAEVDIMIKVLLDTSLNKFYSFRRILGSV